MVQITLISLLTLIATANSQSCFCDWQCALNRDCCLGCQEALCSCDLKCNSTGSLPCCTNCIARCSCATNCVSRHNCCFFCSKANCYCDVLCSLTQPKSCCSFCPNGPSGLLHKSAKATSIKLKQQATYAARYTERYGRI
eukprot:Em0006g1520a